MVTREKLEKETEVFFERHWSLAAIPAWNFSWSWCDPIANHELSGVYALFRGDTLIYIGMGNSHGNGIHRKQSLGKRLLAHVLEIAPPGAEVAYILEERWKNAAVDLVATIGFPQEFAYLASALEHYLIEKLKPPGNYAKCTQKMINK